MLIKRDPFEPIASLTAHLNPRFVNLRTHDGFAPARAVIRESIKDLDDSDGNFLIELQSNGFEARLWELYLNTYFLRSGFSVDRSQGAPDFLLSKAGASIHVEATTCNPTAPGSPLSKPPAETIDGVLDRIENYLPMKLGSPLHSKLSKEYWKLAHVAGKPLIFAIMDFHVLSGDQFFPADPSTGLIGYLYGIDQTWYHDEHGRLVIRSLARETHRHGMKEIPSGFFRQPAAQHVSAVLYSNCATIAKFNRTGVERGLDSGRIRMKRNGFCYNHDPTAVVPLEFSYVVGSRPYAEPWGEGLELFENPDALHPLPGDLFPDAAIHRFTGGQIESTVPRFHPLTSITETHVEPH